ncbi:3-phosphoshikimate 1-carboxyvinyltransferase [Methanimicrococcus blatticola]|uniref:3-phosphoshikimate 1-carboxyvinyltransferase n=1 Tax=Methanimicrococcus blatticola TaxID=91560 RepID=A0A484F676_9EURY|nr:3-phosphoshikimate 1-carboxyvinyltransferase [Methanimicrococcus blatticola]MBZ3936297.1 3-phosphoshikimate 1-carboxyvinyltransferase [Methanimicrococcus blatticola]MCC2508300.1 3-phosphoshikimate 1-carboxyvinyltransferase [Methanimicrococcus blatticola]TDQ70245.1 3-phosphoshikimate 1-carboxyvinyltransferase [Methanimicrococcus blatticola]
MIVSVKKSTPKGTIPAPASKSYTHRAVFIASLGKKEVELSHPLLSADTKSTMEACRLFGANVEERTDSTNETKIIIRGFDGKPKTPEKPIDVGNSGTTLRLMTALAGVADGSVTLTGDESIQKRPNTPLLKTLNEMGAEAYSENNNDCAPLIVRGKIKQGNFSIDGGMSSQFISALLLSCPLLGGDSIISIDGDLKSKPYVDITLEVAEKAGIEIKEHFKWKMTEKDGTKSEVLVYSIPGKQTYDLGNYIIPGDFSSASYLLTAGALIPGAEVEMSGLFPSAQGDSAIVEILEKAGADISWDKENGIIRVSNKNSKRLKGIVWDAGETPDLVPTLSVLGAFSDGETRITNAEHVRFKETDRLKAMATELTKLGAVIEETADGLIISGEKSKNEMKGTAVHGWNDHRIVMSLFIAGMMIGDVTIDTAESVKISYPDFFEEMKKIGAIFEKC